jgi:hypothetical protein
LLEFKADPLTRNKNNRTPLEEHYVKCTVHCEIRHTLENAQEAAEEKEVKESADESDVSRNNVNR